MVSLACFIDNLLQLMLIAVLCQCGLLYSPGVDHWPCAPRGGDSPILLGNLFYAWQALRADAQNWA